MDRAELEKLNAQAPEDPLLEEIKEEEKIGEQAQEQEIRRAQSLQSQEHEGDHAFGGLEPEPVSDEHLAQMDGQQQEQEDECDSDSDLE